jgi:hypothetical protein
MSRSWGVVILEYAPAKEVKPLIDEYTVVAKQLNKLIQNWHKL